VSVGQGARPGPISDRHPGTRRLCCRYVLLQQPHGGKATPANPIASARAEHDLYGSSVGGKAATDSDSRTRYQASPRNVAVALQQSIAAARLS